MTPCSRCSTPRIPPSGLASACMAKIAERVLRAQSGTESGGAGSMGLGLYSSTCLSLGEYVLTYALTPH